MAGQRLRTDPYDQFVPFYDLFYANRQSEIDFYTSLLEPGHRSLLELGCGTGSIIRAVERSATHAGQRLLAIGLDRSFDMLRWAHDRAPAVHWVQGDMSRPPLAGPFDLVFCALNTLQMLESEAALLHTLRAVRALLEPDGRFAFDIYNASHVETVSATPESRINRVVRSFTDDAGRSFEVREDSVDDADGSAVCLDWRVVETSAASPIERGRLVVRLRHYTPAVVEELVQAAGLRVRARHGDVRRLPFDASASKKQVIVCSR
jgi:SAM-dependent methyltransferase